MIRQEISIIGQVVSLIKVYREPTGKDVVNAACIVPVRVEAVESPNWTQPDLSLLVAIL